jgi:O-antigen/teichoic acid export membrane protein
MIQTLLRRYLAFDDTARAFQLAGVFRFALIFIQGIILIKAGVPIAIVGQLELIFFVVNFFQFFWQNGGHQAMLSWKAGPERITAVGTIFGGMHLQAFVAMCLLWIVTAFPLNDEFSHLLSGKNLAGLSAYVFFSIPVGAITYAYMVRNQLSRIIWYTIFAQGAQCVIVVVTMIAGWPVDDLVSALALYAVIRWLVVVVIGKWFSNGMPAFRPMWAFVVFSIPLVLHALNGGVMDYVDGWIVSFFFGDELFALYRFGAREFPLNALLISGLTTGLINRAKIKDQIEGIVLRSETLRMIRRLFPINCLLILLSPLVFTLIYNEEFMLSARIFNIYVLTVLARVILSQVYCYVHHETWVLTWSTAAEIVLNIGLSLLLLNWIGILGIPIATVLAYAGQKVFLIYYVRRRFGVAFSEYAPVRACIWYFAAMILCTVIAEFIYF